MLSFSGSLRIFIALEPCDMRACINTLHALVADRPKQDSRSGSLFVFTNKRRRLLKVLYWDGTGMGLMCKRLEQGTFFWPRGAVASESSAGRVCKSHHQRHAK
jgi:transposase